jgi:DNA-binding NarL/FixJ family response regulator
MSQFRPSEVGGLRAELIRCTESHQTISDSAEPPRIRLMILDQFGLFRVSLSRLLASEPGVEIAGECGTPADAMALLERSSVDLVLLDMEQGVDFILAAQEAGYRGRFLVFSGALDVRRAALALKMGASGMFLKSEAPSLLLHAIWLVTQGEIWIDPKVVHALATELIDRYPKLNAPMSDSSHLPERERLVLSGIVAGHSNRKIGEDMGLSESSVKNVVQRLFSRAGVKTRSQLVRLAIEGTLGAEERKIGEQPEVSNPLAEREAQSHLDPGTRID